MTQQKDLHTVTLLVPRTIDEVISNLNDHNLTCLVIPKQRKYGIQITVEGTERSLIDYVDLLDCEWLTTDGSI